MGGGGGGERERERRVCGGVWRDDDSEIGVVPGTV